MMKLVEGVLARRRVLLTVALMMSGFGLLSWVTMPREEDPRLADRVGVLVVPFPGATPSMVERLVVEPLEEQLFRVAEVKRIRADARTGVTIAVIELGGSVTDTETAWDEVEDAIERARRDFPSEVLPARLQREIMADQEAMVFALTGAPTTVDLLKSARTLESALVRLPGVSRVEISGIASEQLTVTYDPAAARRLGLSPEDLAAQLRAATHTIPGGSLVVDGVSATVFTGSAFEGFEALASFPVRLVDGTTLPLAQVATLAFGAEDPARERMRFDGAPALAVGIVPSADIDVVALGDRVRQTVQATPVAAQVHEMSFQPDRVEGRLSDLLGSLLLGMAIVAVVLIVLMGARMGLVVASVVPLVALTSIGLYAVGGGVLHQIAVAALVIALGMLVDNAIVVAELVQSRMDEGVPAYRAAALAVRELIVPLGVATGTTLAAFVPMAAAQGNVGDFTRAIPIVIMLTLVVSYVYALLVTPVLSTLALKPSTKSDDRWTRAADRIARLGVERPWRVLAAAGILLVFSGLGAGKVDKSFFPASGRDQLVVEVLMPEGTHLDTTDDYALRLERELLGHPDVQMVASFVGRSAPKFYYNLPTRPDAAHSASVVVRTVSPEAIPALQAHVRRFARDNLLRAQVIPRTLEQGPPIDAPIEVRLVSNDLERSFAAAEEVIAALRAVPGAVNVRHDQGFGTPRIDLRLADSAIVRRGAARASVASATLSRTRGLTLGHLRYGDDPVPLVLRTGEGERTEPMDLAATDVFTPFGAQPMAALAAVAPEWQPAVIHRRDGRRVITVSAQTLDGVAYSRVLDAIAPTLANIEGVDVELGGNAEGSGDANAAIVSAAPLGIVLLVLLLLLEFDSFRRLGIILSTVPLAAAGVVPGLLIGDQPFGFMSVLGVSALIGIVVNNAIVLLDRIEAGRAAGDDVETALVSAVRERTRPILLTSATTVLGLMPLAFSSSPLWPPMASAMIAGLVASTGLTLLVVPALYRLLFNPRATSSAQEVVAHA